MGYVTRYTRMEDARCLQTATILEISIFKSVHFGHGLHRNLHCTHDPSELHAFLLID